MEPFYAGGTSLKFKGFQKK